MSAGMLLLKGDPDPIRVRRPRSEDDTRQGRPPRIRCPKCSWEPGRDDTWACVCLHIWNTFETRGVCPKCGLKWLDTQCQRCSQWSPHDDWYEEPGRIS